MKAILEFTLPEEKGAFKRAANAQAMVMAVQEYDNYLRSLLKYEEMNEEVFEALTLARSKLHELIADEGTNLWEE